MAGSPLPERPPTLRDVARLAGVSHTTVSLSLRNHPSIPDATRERVRQSADRVGYRSNLLVSALMSQVRLKRGRSAPEVVGFLTGGPSAQEWREHSASVGFFEGAKRRAAQVGMHLEPFWLGSGGVQAAAVCRMLHARSIQGVLVTPFPVPDYPHELAWKHLVCVGLGYVYNNHALHRATHNHFKAAFKAHGELEARGYRRIGLMLDREENRRVNFQWLGGYLAAQHTAGGASIPPLLTEGAGRAQARAWLTRYRPDAVIGFGARQFVTLREAGWKVPEQGAFAALDVEQAAMGQVDRVSGINQNFSLIGATAIDILASQLYHNELGLPARPVYSMIDGYWVDGTTAPTQNRG